MIIRLLGLFIEIYMEKKMLYNFNYLNSITPNTVIEQQLDNNG